ncbi:D-amino-acid oxidase [Penicillium macrosclerotiorum]|uniref:D-amino-acid oxidase n=1 Tax=Penicillium macrosclerotiorum TaxID=303699 RepID=UPI002546BDE8|nr:D-amino-acid oxidase [Penicillium macrosclerotiorum]KAJ5666785.1 D-amino-acid oxidase [Penicillium macrosclerotiorum]
MTANNIVVIGAGVSGLTTALLLSQDPANKVTVASKHMPGDYDIEYASPWAGANYMPKIRFGKKDSDHAEWERATWPKLRDLAKNHPESGIHFQDVTIHNRIKDQDSVTGQWSAELTQAEPWFKDVVPNFQNLPREQLPGDIDNAQKFTSVCINTAIYLPWLVGQCIKNGCVFRRGVFKHISDAADAHHSGAKANVVVNCTGLASRTLGGVVDSQVYPVRGQIMIVRNDPGSMSVISGSDDGGDEVSYIFPRAAGGGTVIGGTYQKDQWDPLPDPNTANRIMQRAIKLDPRLVKKGQGVEGLDIVRHGVGLRPARTDGPRIEKDQVNGVKIVHNYGHGGFGYQVSFSCAEKAANLVNELISGQDRAKL